MLIPADAFLACATLRTGDGGGCEEWRELGVKGAKLSARWVGRRAMAACEDGCCLSGGGWVARLLVGRVVEGVIAVERFEASHATVGRAESASLVE